MSNTPEFWKDRVQTALLESKQIPMWQSFPSFPWKSLNKNLCQIFDSKIFDLSLAAADWKNKDKVYDGFGENCLCLSMLFSPLSSPFFLLIAKEDLPYLAKSLSQLNMDDSPTESEEFQEGFLKYCALQALQSFHDITPYQDLSLRLSNNSLDCSEDAYCIDVLLNKEKKQSTSIRVVCPKPFHTAITAHYSSKPISLENQDSNAPITLSLYSGVTKLTVEEWNNIKLGDFLVLDKALYNPESKEGSVLLALHNSNLFRVAYSDNNIKISDYAQLEEDAMVFDDEIDDSDEDFDDDELHEEDFDDEIDDDFDDEIDDDFDDEDLDDEESEEDTPLQESDDSSIEFSDNESKVKTESVITTKNIPLTIRVEVGKFEMPLQKLLALQPGNTLDLSVSPENVQLTVSGKVVAKGKLMQLGDVVGVKITEIAH